MLRYIPFALLLMISFASGAQTIHYYNGKDKEVKTAKKASYYEEIYERTGDTLTLVKRYDISGNLVTEGHFISVKLRIREGKHTSYYPDGKISTVTEYKAGKMHGMALKYDQQGRLISEKEYSEGNPGGVDREYWPERNILKYERTRCAETLREETRRWNESGSLVYQLISIDYKFDGEVIICRDDGTLRRRDIYSLDELVEGACYAKDGSDTIWYPYMVYPSFNGVVGIQPAVQAFSNYVSGKVEYPFEALLNLEYGKVTAGFIVDQKGKVAGPVILSSPSTSLSKEVLSVLKKSPAWTPGSIDGKPDSFRFTISVNFKLPPRPDFY